MSFERQLTNPLSHLRRKMLCAVIPPQLAKRDMPCLMRLVIHDVLLLPSGKVSSIDILPNFVCPCRLHS
jgi:hypothetical protein